MLTGKKNTVWIIVLANKQLSKVLLSSPPFAQANMQ